MQKLKNYMIKRLDIFRGYTIDEKLITVSVVSMFLPFFVVVIPVLLTVFWVISDTRRRTLLTQAPCSLFVYALLLIFCLGAVLHSNWMGLMVGIIIWLFFIYSLYLRCFMNKKLFANSINLILQLSLFSALVAAVQKMIHPSARATSTFFNPNYYGFMIEIFVLLGIFYIVNAKQKKQRIFYFFTVCVNLYALILCNCKTAWIGIFIGSLIILLLSHHYKSVMLIFLGAAVVFICARYFPEIIPRGDNASINHAAEQRELMWSISFKTALQSPFVGRGAYAYSQIWNMHEVGYKTVHCHNIFINSFLDVGIVGSLCWIIYILSYPVFAFKKRFDNGGMQRFILILAVLAACISHSITDIPVLGIQTSLIVFIVLSCAGTTSAAKKIQQKDNGTVLHEKI